MDLLYDTGEVLLKYADIFQFWLKSGNDNGHTCVSARESDLVENPQTPLVIVHFVIFITLVTMV
jgi:hypothetical protein